MTQPRIRITSIGGSGDGTPGDPGDSAYQVAVNNGFIGTEQEWLDSLIGQDGLDGANGIDGVDALWNFTGEWLNGIDYAAGDLVTFNGSLYYTATGVYSSYSPGYPGADWVLAASKGEDGADGADGIDGAQGPKGDQGDPGPGGADGHYGSFYDTSNHTISQAYTPQVLTINSDYGSNGISIVDGSKILISKAGTYTLTSVIHVHNSANSVEYITIWIKFNGIDYPNSAVHTALQPRKDSSTPSAQLVTITFTGTATEDNQYVELFWEASSTNISVNYHPIENNSPLMPSVIASITQVMSTQVGPMGLTGPAGPKGDTGATGPAGLTAVASGVVNAGTFVTMDNLKFTVTSSGNRGLSVATVSGTASLYTSGSYSGATVGHSGIATGGAVTYTTTPTSSLYGWGFPVAGDWSQYVFVDTVNVKMYRVNLIIGPSYNNNFISVERVIG